jgi:hypothetical protein
LAEKKQAFELGQIEIDDLLAKGCNEVNKLAEEQMANEFQVQ